MSADNLGAKPNYGLSSVRMEWHKKRIEEEIKIVSKASRRKPSEVIAMKSSMFDGYLRSSGYKAETPPWKN